MLIVKNLRSFFEDSLSRLKCEDDTRAYIVGLLSEKRDHSIDPKRSLVLKWASVRDSGDFSSLQNLGDDIFWTDIIARDAFPADFRNLYLAIGANAYYKCYRILKNQWKVYEELADRMHDLSKQSRELIFKPLPRADAR